MKKKYRKKWRMTSEKDNGLFVNIVFAVYIMVFILGLKYVPVFISDNFPQVAAYFNWNISDNDDVFSLTCAVYALAFAPMMFMYLFYRIFGYAMNEEGIWLHTKNLKQTLVKWEDLQETCVIITNSTNPFATGVAGVSVVPNWAWSVESGLRTCPWISFYGKETTEEIFEFYKEFERTYELTNLPFRDTLGFTWPRSYKGLWPDAFLEHFTGEIFVAMSTLVAWDKEATRLIEKYHISLDRIHVLKDCKEYEMVTEGDRIAINLTFDRPEYDRKLTKEELRAKMTEDEKRLVDQYTIN